MLKGWSAGVYPILVVVALGCTPSGAGAVCAQSAERAGPTFRVVYEGEREGVDNEAIARDALEAAESVVTLARETFGDAERERELGIHLYRRSADYVRVEGRVTGGVFRHNLAFSSFLYKRAHVAVQPECGRETFKSMGLSSLTRRQIAHEAAHLFSFAAMPSYRHHPEWFSEGAAMWIAGTIMRRKRWAESIERDPSTSMRIVLGQRMIRDERLPSVEDLLAARVEKLTAEERYAIHWLFFRMLKQRAWQRRFDWVLREARSLKPGSDFKDRLRERFSVAFSAKEIERMNTALRRGIARMAPAWEIDGTPPQVEGSTWWSIADPDQSAAAWRVKPIAKDVGQISGHLEILPGLHDAVRLLFGREREACHCIRFSRCEGIALARYDPKDRDWHRISADPTPFPDEGARVVVVVSADAITVSIGGKKRLSLPRNQVTIRGQWGIAAEEGAAARWARMKATR